MAIDFFIQACQTENITDKVFGLCDDDDNSVKTPAYISRDVNDKWIAKVNNTSGKSLNFTAIDNCVEIKRDNGDMESRCDAMLTNEDNIVFVELKTKNSDWIKGAVEDQLQTTIDYFKENHDISKYKKKRAFVCNRKHPNFQVSYKDLMNQFYKQNGIRLNLEARIIFK